MTAPAIAVSLAAERGLPSPLLPSVAERTRRAWRALAYRWDRPLSPAQCAARVVEGAVRDWREGVLERCLGSGGEEGET